MTIMILLTLLSLSDGVCQYIYVYSMWSKPVLGQFTKRVARTCMLYVSTALSIDLDMGVSNSLSMYMYSIPRY